jgi:hypothetical protein
MQKLDDLAKQKAIQKNQSVKKLIAECRQKIVVLVNQSQGILPQEEHTQPSVNMKDLTSDLATLIIDDTQPASKAEASSSSDLPGIKMPDIRHDVDQAEDQAYSCPKLEYTKIDAYKESVALWNLYDPADEANIVADLMDVRSNIIKKISWFFNPNVTADERSRCYTSYESDLLIIKIRRAYNLFVKTKENQEEFVTTLGSIDRKILGCVFYEEACHKIDAINEILRTIKKGDSPEEICITLWRKALSLKMLLYPPRYWCFFEQGRQLLRSLIQQCSKKLENNVFMQSIYFGLRFDHSRFGLEIDTSTNYLRGYSLLLDEFEHKTNQDIIAQGAASFFAKV